MSDQATTLKIKPLGDRILVKREEEASTARGGIILPDTAKKNKTELKFWPWELVKKMIMGSNFLLKFRLATSF